MNTQEHVELLAKTIVRPTLDCPKPNDDELAQAVNLANQSLTLLYNYRCTPSELAEVVENLRYLQT